MNNIAVTKYKLKVGSKIIANIKAIKDVIVKFAIENTETLGSKFSKIMLTLSLLKLILAIITLIVMTVLLIRHLHVLEPITVSFSRWATSPIICFIMLVVILKFVGLLIGLTLTLMSIKQISIENIRVRLIGYCKSRFISFLRAETQHQKDSILCFSSNKESL